MALRSHRWEDLLEVWMRQEKGNTVLQGQRGMFGVESKKKKKPKQIKRHQKISHATLIVGRK